MELLWLRTRDIVAFGTAGNDAIDNGTLIRTVKKVLKDTGVSTRAIEQWDEKAAADKTWPNFQTHFETANLRRLEDLTAADAGLGGAHTANSAVTAPPTTLIASILPLKPHGRGYCWTHGYRNNSNHTSLTCNNKAPGHRDATTIKDMFGGNNTVTRKRDQPAVYRSPRHHLGPNSAASATTNT